MFVNFPIKECGGLCQTSYIYKKIFLIINYNLIFNIKNFSQEVSRKMNAQGVFVLVSSKQITTDKILPLYYTRQQVEQIFDIGKNYPALIPIRIQTEETFRGHLLLTFIASILVKRIQDKLLKTS